MNSNIFSKGLAHRLDEEKRKNLRSAQVEDENFKNTFFFAKRETVLWFVCKTKFWLISAKRCFGISGKRSIGLNCKTEFC